MPMLKHNCRMPRSVRMYSDRELFSILKRAAALGWDLDTLDGSMTLFQLEDKVNHAERVQKIGRALDADRLRDEAQLT